MYVDAVAVVPEHTAFVAVVTVAGAVLARRR
jgi:hypothetical protein